MSYRDDYVEMMGIDGEVHVYPQWLVRILAVTNRRLVRSGRSPILERDQGSGLHRILPNAFEALEPFLDLRDIRPRRYVRAMDYLHHRFGSKNRGYRNLRRLLEDGLDASIGRSERQREI